MNKSLSPSTNPKYKCAKCGREVYATRDGYLPVHRVKKGRARCDGSGAHISFHKKLT